MNVEIRPMTRADLESVLDLAASCAEAPHWRAADYGSYLEPNAQSPVLRAAFVAVLKSQDSQVPDCPIVGFAAASLLPDPGESEARESRCDLDTIAVAASARRQGIGTALLRSVLTWAAGHQATRLSLEVRASNLPAVRLYEQLGFRREGVRRRYYADPADDALLLTRLVTGVP